MPSFARSSASCRKSVHAVTALRARGCGRSDLMDTGFVIAHAAGLFEAAIIDATLEG